MGIIKNNIITIKKYWSLNINKNKEFDSNEFESIFSNNLKFI